MIKCPHALFQCATHAMGYLVVEILDRMEIRIIIVIIINIYIIIIIKPPTSMDMMEKATQRLQTGLGMRMKLTTIMNAEVTNTDWMD